MVTAFSDPGIARKISTSENELKPRALLITQLGVVVKYKQCASCAIIRPLRSHHCRDCDNCVERFDHHCPWIGNCVGVRNYPFFYYFLLSLNVLTIYLAAFSIAKITTDVIMHQNQPEASTKLCENIVSIYIAIYCGLSMLFTTGLLFYHTNLLSKNLTTKEELKKVFDNTVGNPFKRSICSNWASRMGRKVPKKTIVHYLTHKRPEEEQVKVTNSHENPRKSVQSYGRMAKDNNSKVLNDDIMIDFSDNKSIELKNTISNRDQCVNNSQQKSVTNSKENMNDSLSSYYCDKSSFTARHRFIPIFIVKETALPTSEIAYSKSLKEKRDRTSFNHSNQLA